MTSEPVSLSKQRRAAKARLPAFIYDFVAGGVGYETCLDANRRSLDAVKLKPRRLMDGQAPDCASKLFGRRYDAPFGVAPIGFGNVIWPGMADILAAAAGRHNVPFIASTYTLSSPERIHELARGNAWLQLYVPKSPDIELAVLNRAKAIGYDVLVVTVDCPKAERRTSETRPGFSLAPKHDLATLAQVAARPLWAVKFMRGRKAGMGILEPFLPVGSNLRDSAKLLTGLVSEHVSPERLKRIRDRWPGKLVVKGVLAGEDAAKCAAIGADGIVVSNHGGRQLDAAPAALEVIGEVRRAAGAGIAILADGGVLSGLDVARMIARGADFAFAGRAFVYGVAGNGSAGADQIFSFFKRDLAATLTQIGCTEPAQLPSFLMTRRPAGRAEDARYYKQSLTPRRLADAEPTPRPNETYGRALAARARERAP